MKNRPIKIIFDAVPLASTTKSGIGKSVEGIVLSLAHAYPDEVELVGHYFNFLGRKKGYYLPSAPNIRYRKTIFLPGKVFNVLRRLRIPVPYELMVKERGDFHLFLAFLGWRSLFHTPYAVFAHDLTYLLHPEFVSSKMRSDLVRLMPGTLGGAAFIIANSASSQLGFMKAYGLERRSFLPISLPPVSVQRLSKQEADDRISALGIRGKYLLFLGTLEPRKNVVSLLEAYEKLSRSVQSTHTLVLAGGKGWNDEAISASLDRLSQGGSNVLQLGYVSDVDKAALYMGATLYCLPSHYEGFGMPLLEAMHYGTPILASDIPVFREVCDGAALYCGTSSQTIAASLEYLLRSPSVRKVLSQRGAERVASFSWDEIARKLYKRIRETS